MTCIIGIECEDGAVIAGDCLGSNGWTKRLVTQSKIFEHSGMLFGYTSTFRFGQIIEHMLDDNSLYPPTDPEDTYSWLVRVFVPKLKSTLLTNDYKDGGNALMIVNSQVWEIQNDFSVLRATCGVSSVGSGEAHAMSSVLTMLIVSVSDQRKPYIEEAKRMIEHAYQVTSMCVTSVSSEYNVITVGE